MSTLSQKQNKIHEEILKSVANYQQLEWKIIELLQNAEACRLPRAFELRSLFEYATSILKLDEARAYMLISLARKSKAVPSLAIALKNETISAAKAARVVSIIDIKNATELIDFARTHTKREVEFEVARRNPRAAIERVKPVSEDRVEVTLSMSKVEYESLLRVQSLEARQNLRANISETVTAAVSVYLFHRDPVAKAERNVNKGNHATSPANSRSENQSRELCPGRVGEREVHNQRQDLANMNRNKGFSKRTPLTATQRHAANFVSKGRCTHIFPDGGQCNQDRFVDLHHIVEVSRGGTNHPSNLRALCRFHHDLIHRKPHTVPTFDEWIEIAARSYMNRE